MKKLSIICLIVQSLLMSAICAKAQIIRTVAGSNDTGYTGNGGPATAATLHMPFGVAINSSGNLFIADTYNGVIRKVNSAGIITTVAGGGVNPPADGGPATDAQFFYPIDVAADNAGNIYIAAQSNIFRVSASGIVSNVAGNGIPGYGGDGSQATAAMLNGVEGVTVDASGNLYIADAVNDVIRKVNTAGIISTVAGNGTTGFYGDGGPATLAMLDTPAKVAVDGAGNIYISDSRNFRLRKVNTSGVISTIAGGGIISGDGGPATAAQLADTWGITIDGAENLFFTDAFLIRKINSAGIITTVAGSLGEGFSGDGGAATAAELFAPAGVAVDGAGNIFIADMGNNRIRKVTPGTSTGINQAANAYDKLAIYPNPNNGVFVVGGSLDIPDDEDVSVQIFNLRGQPVFQSYPLISSGIMDRQITLDEGLPGGIYLLRISSANETHSFRVLIKK